MIGELGEPSLYACAQIFEFLVQTPIFKKFVRVIYKSERSTCRSLGTRFLTVYWLKKSFLIKVKVDPDPLFPNVDPRIRIHYYGKVDPLFPYVDPRIRIWIHVKMRWIRNAA